MKGVNEAVVVEIAVGDQAGSIHVGLRDRGHLHLEEKDPHFDLHRGAKLIHTCPEVALVP